MKKTALLILAVLILSTVSVSAMGIGGAFSFDALGTESAIPGGALTIKLDNFAPVFGFGVKAGDGNVNLGITADLWMHHAPLAGIVSLYVGPGAYANITVGDSNALDLGLRIPVGLQIFPIEPLELFIELAPKVGLGLNPLEFPTWGIQGALGFRFWF